MTSSSMESALKNSPFWVPSDSDGSNSGSQNPSDTPVESNRIVMVSPPASEEDEEEEVFYTPPVTEESVGFDGDTVAAEADNSMAVDLGSDTDKGVSKMSDLDKEGLELLVYLHNTAPENDKEVEPQEPGGPSVKMSRLEISTGNEGGKMKGENDSIPKPRKDEPKKKRALPPSFFNLGVKNDEKPKVKRNPSSPDGKDEGAGEREPVDPIMPDILGKNLPKINICDVLRQLVNNRNEEEDKRLASMTLLEVAEARWGKF